MSVRNDSAQGTQTGYEPPPLLLESPPPLLLVSPPPPEPPPLLMMVVAPWQPLAPHTDPAAQTSHVTPFAPHNVGMSPRWHFPSPSQQPPHVTGSQTGPS
jgi:hypothetical protein